ncbi:MAG: hypothetical protein AB1529_00690 [Candidatus Micrarchaeota archaeon]
MDILVFGLADEDSMLARLRKRFPDVGFRKFDISQELDEESRRLVVIDTMKGIDRVTLLDDPGRLSPGKALEGSGSMMTLRILLRIGSLDSVKVIAVPEGYPQDDAFSEICAIIESLPPGS